MESNHRRERINTDNEERRSNSIFAESLALTVVSETQGRLMAPRRGQLSFASTCDTTTDPIALAEPQLSLAVFPQQLNFAHGSSSSNNLAPAPEKIVLTQARVNLANRDLVPFGENTSDASSVVGEKLAPSGMLTFDGKGRTIKLINTLLIVCQIVNKAHYEVEKLEQAKTNQEQNPFNSNFLKLCIENFEKQKEKLFAEPWIAKPLVKLLTDSLFFLKRKFCYIPLELCQEMTRLLDSFFNQTDEFINNNNLLKSLSPPKGMKKTSEIEFTQIQHQTGHKGIKGNLLKKVFCRRFLALRLKLALRCAWKEKEYKIKKKKQNKKLAKDESSGDFNLISKALLEGFRSIFRLLESNNMISSKIIDWIVHSHSSPEDASLSKVAQTYSNIALGMSMLWPNIDAAVNREISIHEVFLQVAWNSEYYRSKITKMSATTIFSPLSKKTEKWCISRYEKFIPICSKFRRVLNPNIFEIPSEVRNSIQTKKLDLPEEIVQNLTSGRLTQELAQDAGKVIQLTTQLMKHTTAIHVTIEKWKKNAKINAKQAFLVMEALESCSDIIARHFASPNDE